MKNFLIIWMGELISSIGGGMTAFALTIYALKVTNSVSAVSLITLLAFLPTVLLSPLGGLLADHYDRRLLMIIGDSFSALGLVYILWQLKLGASDLSPIYFGVIISAVFSSLVEPAYRATVSDLLTEKEYGKASGMVQLASNARYLISPALAGFLLAYFDIRVILWIDIISFLVAAFMISFVKRAMNNLPSKSKIATKDTTTFKAVLSFLKKQRGIQALIAIMTIVCFFIGLVQILIEPLILNIADTQTVGTMETLCTFGLLAGSLWIGIKGIKSKHASILTYSGLCGGLFICLSGFTMHLWWIGLMIFFFFMTLAFINTCADVLIRVSTPRHLQGRMWGIISFVTQFGTIIAYICSGYLADKVFEPLMAKEGALAHSVGIVIGVGAGRGIGLMLILSGLGLMITFLAIGHNHSIKQIHVHKEESVVSD